MIARFPLLLPMLLVTACDAGSDNTQTGGLTAGEAERLEKAAERIDARGPSPAAADAAALEADVRAKLDAERQAATR